MARISPWAALAGAAVSSLLATLQGCGTPPPTPAPPVQVDMEAVMSKEEQYGTLEAFFTEAQECLSPISPNGSRDRALCYMKGLEYIQTKLIEFAPEFETMMQVLPYNDRMWKQNKPTELYYSDKHFTEENPGVHVRSALVNMNGTAAGTPWRPEFDPTGCNESELPDLTGKVAVYDSARCPTSTACLKIQYAAEAGAEGVIIVYPEGSSLGRSGLRSCPPAVPIASVSYEVGMEILAADSVRIDTFSEWDESGSSNLCLDLPGGDKSKVFILGAHLDSVMYGPGANDNGSGSALLLEIARAFVRRYGATGDLLDMVKNSFRLCWWGSEEWGLIGSRRWVNMTSQSELDKILGYINFDMMAGPNGVNAVNLGSGDIYNPNASAYIQYALQDAFAARGTYSVTGGLSGSDFLSFYEVGIPFSGLLSGAGSACSESMSNLSGCTIGVPYDACYHRYCDVPSHISQDRQLLFSQVAARVTQNFLEDAELSTKLARQNLDVAEAEQHSIAELHDCEGDEDFQPSEPRAPAAATFVV